MQTKTDAKPVEIFLRKCSKTRIFTYFVTQSAQKFGPLRHMIFSTHLKVLAMSKLNNTDVKPVETFWENDQWPEFLLVWGAKMVPKLGLWGPYSTHFWKYLWASEAILMWNLWKLFEKVTKVQNFHLLWDPKWPKNWAFEAHIVHISESSSNEHIMQDWCESRGNILTK